MSVHAPDRVHKREIGAPDGRRVPARAGAWPVPAETPSWAEETLLQLQRLAGNGAVVQLLRDARPIPPRVQRDADEDEELATPAAEGGDATAASGESAGGATSEAGEMPQPMFDESSSGGGGESASGESGAGESASGESASGESASGESVSGESASGSEGEAASGEESGSHGGAEVADGSGESDDGSGESDDGGQSQEDQDRKATEGDSVTGSDPMVEMTGGPPPYAGPLGGGFHDGGRSGTVPFGDAPSCSLVEEAAHPHAFVGGGASGTVKWSGGGPARGPKGNQGSGSLQAETKPEYDTKGNGPFSNSDAWVRTGTAAANVTRDYSTSNAGDQGNGWWISNAAAAYLDGHEQRHVASAREVYGSTIGNLDDRVSKSADYGRGKLYWASDAITYVSNYIAWKRTLEEFKDQDASWNAPQGEVDQRDLGSGSYPRNQKGPKTIGGTQFDNYLIMPSEPDPT